MQHCSRFQCCCLSWILIVIAHLITEALSCIGISHPSWEKEMVPGRKMRLNVARLFFFFTLRWFCEGIVLWVFFLSWRGHNELTCTCLGFTGCSECVCVCVCECVWVAQTKQTPSVRPSVSSLLTSAASKPSLLHLHSPSENTLFEKKQETILEKDVITSQFTLPAFCYGVCVCVCVCVCVVHCLCAFDTL